MKKAFFVIFIILFPVALSAQLIGSGTLADPYSGGTLLSDLTWTTSNSPIYVSGDITIGSPSTAGHLTIQSGVTVLFVSTDADLIITGKGQLTANGTAGNNIRFTADNNKNGIYGETGETWGHISFENVTGSATSTIDYCIIEYGKKTSGVWGPQSSGGGIYISYNNVTVSNSIIRNNYAYYGGGICVVTSTPNIYNCNVNHNTAQGSGGGFIFDSNTPTVVQNCLIAFNSANLYGGGGIFVGDETGNLGFYNCVIASNSGGTGSDIRFYKNNQAQRPHFDNTIVWGNSYYSSIYYGSYQTPQTTDFVNCAIQGYSSGYTNCISLNSNNSASTGPNFNATDGSDWSIKFISPCLDKGLDHSSDSNVPLLDIAGNSRIGATDIGAYEVQNYIYTWQGDDATYPSYWNVGANWNANTAPPDNIATILIPAGLTNYPTGTSPDYSIGTGHDFTVEAGAKVTFNSLTNYGNLYLNSSSSGFASMIVSSYTRGSGGTEFIQLFLAGGGNEDDDNFKWHYISTPVTSLAASTFAPGATLDLAQYVESRPTLSLLQGWVAYDGYVYSTGVSNGPTFTTLNPGKGYDFWDSNDNTFTFSGLFNTSNDAVSLPYSGTPSLNGFNLLGNPFMSGLDWNAIANGVYFTFPSNTSKGVYFTRDNVQCSYIAGVGIPGDVNGIIPPMQGFFTKTFSTGNTITLAAAARTNTGIHATYKGSETIPLVRLNLSNGSANYDETVVRFDAAAKSTLDYDFDAIKLNPSTTQNQIYTEYEGTKYAINGLPFSDPSSIVEIPVVINLTKSGNYTISMTQLQALGSYDIGLKDNNTGITTNLCNALKLTFSSEAGTISDRFVLRIGDIWTGVEEVSKSKSQFNFYEFDKLINIVPLTDDWAGKKASISIIDLSGRYLSNYSNLDLVSNSVTSVPAPAVSGLYLLEIRSGLKRYVGKVIIR